MHDNSAVVLMKLGAVLIVIYVLQMLPQHVIYLAAEPPLQILLIVTVALCVGLSLVIAWALWRFPDKLAGLGGDAAEADSAPLPAEELMRVGAALIGLYACVFGVLDLVYWETIQLSYRQRDPAYALQSQTPQDLAGRVTYFVQIVFGAVLIVGRQSIAAALARARRAGVDVPR